MRFLQSAPGPSASMPGPAELTPMQRQRSQVGCAGYGTGLDKARPAGGQAAVILGTMQLYRNFGVALALRGCIAAGQEVGAAFGRVPHIGNGHAQRFTAWEWFPEQGPENGVLRPFSELPVPLLQGTEAEAAPPESPVLKWSPSKPTNNPTLYPGAMVLRSSSSLVQSPPSHYPIRQTSSRTGRSLFQSGEGEGDAS
jgi:hypothetical protein